MATPQEIKHFAVSYEAFWDAIRVPEGDRDRQAWGNILGWSRMLKESQEAVGVEILEPITLQNHMDNARAHIDKLDGYEAMAEKRAERARDAAAEIATSR